MLSNNLKIAIRSLWRNKLYTIVNVLGLTVGFVCVILIALYLLDELTFDQFHQKAAQIYRVIEKNNDPIKGENHNTGVPYKLGPEALSNFPEVRNAASLTEMGRTAISNEEKINAFYVPIYMTNSSFFEVFDFPLILGTKENCLSKPNTVVLSEEMATKIFGDQNPIGQIVYADRGFECTVTGVLEALPSNSHLKFDALFSIRTLEPFDFYEGMIQGDWNSNGWWHYYQVQEGANIAALDQKLTAMVLDHQENKSTYNSSFYLQPLKDIHFYSGGFKGDLNHQKGDITYVYIFSIVGLFVLFIACINYMNLVTSRSSTYSKEVGIRKVVGANKSSLISRFMSESVLMSLIAFAIAVNVVYLVLPTFNTFFDKELSLSLSNAGYVLPLLIGIVLLVALLSGIYPSLYLSRFDPVKVLKKNQVRGQKQLSLRKSLVVFQFVLSVILIISTGIAISQMDYIQEKNLGFNQDQLVVVDINSRSVRAGYHTIKTGYENLAAVKSVSVSSRVPGEWKVLPTLEVALPGQSTDEASLNPYFMGADEAFLETFEIELLQGRTFDSSRQMDSAAVIINETAARLMGIERLGTEEYAITAINFDGNLRIQENPFRVKVIGIVKDFHFQSLHEKIQPIFIAYRNNPLHRIDYFTARVSMDNIDATIASMESILHSVDPGHTFEYHFLDAQLEQFYQNDNKRSTLFSMAALLAIFIACLGLFGLSAFAAEQRTKEIGIRKVLGASIVNLIALLSKDFLRLVGLAILIAIPLAWYVAQVWLQNFAYTVKLQWWMFVIPSLLAILIALLTVSFQSVKVAISNPVKALRWE